MESRFKLGLELKTIVNLLCRRMGEEPDLETCQGLTAVQVWIIEYLYENEGRDIYQRDVEGEFQVRRSTVTGILQGLERRGLICRQAVEQDARLKKLTLTPAAKIVYEQSMKRIERLEEEVLKDISPEEWAQFYLVLEKIKKNLSQ